MNLKISPHNPKAEYVSYNRVCDLATYQAGIKLFTDPSLLRHKVWFGIHGGSITRIFSKLRFSLGGITVFEIPFEWTSTGSTVPYLRFARCAGMAANESTPIDYSEGFFCKPPSAISTFFPGNMQMFCGSIDQAEIVPGVITAPANMAIFFAVFSDNNI